MFVKLDKKDGFIGCDSLLQQKEEGLLKQRMVQFLLDDPQPLFHGTEVIYRDGTSVGYLTTAGYGFTLGGAVGMGFVKHDDGVSSDFIRNGIFEIDIAGKRFLAKASLRPLYDHKNERVRR